MKYIIFLFLCLLCTAPYAAEITFLATKEGKTLVKEGNTFSRAAPCSTFKVALAVMGFDTGILKDSKTPLWEYKSDYDALSPDMLCIWQQDQTPETWIKYSCVWYSQKLTQQMGMKAMQGYVNAFQYGNRNLSGDVGKNNGLTHCWLSSSLRISPQEQITFLNKLLRNELPASPESQEKARALMYMGKLDGDWQLYGKTGSGRQPKRRSQAEALQMGWFVGWIERGEERILFALHLRDTKAQKGYASIRAKALAKKKLLQLIRNPEKLNPRLSKEEQKIVDAASKAVEGRE